MAASRQRAAACSAVSDVIGAAIIAWSSSIDGGCQCSRACPTGGGWQNVGAVWQKVWDEFVPVRATLLGGGCEGSCGASE